ncbi:MAG: twin-arginine translocase TatA/TatE family subunit [Alphaproteobacteria bacterium]|jgi:sec-independent protein translocase protein TatA|nr:twin-arginine translocase TatA/TatE family subunit [Alphaproteobacteria bacterium]
MSIGIWQIVLILVIVLILFGAGKLPRVMGDVAKGVKSFKAGLKDDETADAAPAKEVPHAEAAAAEPAEMKSDEPAKT